MIRTEPDLVDKSPGKSPAHLEVVPQQRQLAPDSGQASGYEQNLPVRLTRSVFDDLAIWMIGVGIVIGAVFPPMLVVFGVPAEIVLTPFFFFVCLVAGIAVGGINIWLMRVVVMPRLRALVDGMRMIQSVVENATYTGDWTDCDPESCQLPVDSNDAIGESASAFNHLIRVLQHSHEVEERVGEFSKTMTSQLELGPLCNGALSGFIAATSATAGAIVADVGGELSVLASFGIVGPESLCENDQVRMALRTQEPVYVELPEGLSVNAGLVEFQPREVAFMPLVFQSKATGVVVLAKSTPFERDSRSMSQIFGRTFVTALSNAMKHGDLQRIAALDPLTNCYNRRFGLTRLREEFTRATRYESPLGLIMFDIDHFKSINDSHGHLIGDRIIANVAKEAKANLREGDVLVRYGGEEFLCILPGASVEGAGEVCERIRQSIEAMAVRDRGQTIGCTVSLGFASIPATTAEDETALIQVTDEALYRAKNDGRNRTVEAA
ncbi:MAG: GGDEF domain-containing protein [Gammaproteobacteria bacterium]|nr:GGDEF domain-containing protein [Gammaproteobacteria bacterium]NNL49479.1 GGDEF domain-containing protein [Woeseiaceae bacterium]